jgi:membrane protein
MILPNVRTRAGSALLGAAVAALLWQAALVLHVRFQVGVARYNALYSVLGAIPIFLVWTYLSWLIVLVGAQLAASHQNERSSRQRLRAQRADQAVKEVLAVAVAARVARDFLDEARRRRADELADLLEVPPPAVEDVLEPLVRTGVLARAVCAGEIGYVPGRDLDAVRVTDVRDALRREPEADPIRSAVSRQLGGDLERMLRALDEERRASSRNLTLRQLAALVAPAPAAPAAPRDPTEASRPPVLDSKQPEIPS